MRRQGRPAGPARSGRRRGESRLSRDTQTLKNAAVLISGRGSNLSALMAAQGSAYRIVLVVSNVEGAGGLEIAAAAGIPVKVIPHQGKSRETFDAEVDAVLREAGADIVCLAGFMRILSDGFVRAWEGKLVNIHPSLLPAYKGIRVHERVIEAKEALSGASVHFVVPELDAGPVIAQGSVPVHPSDTPQTLAARVLEIEHSLYPQALQLLATGGVRLEKGLAVFG
ncbi:MAG: phosphoribosylglycinamide formyltransferase [Alphaproteobacteria bacterium]|nr:phosphoribosylglycinamide formyltransferase [Alphaproteobacteria bacterium]